jgi:hypothetical protein
MPPRPGAVASVGREAAAQGSAGFHRSSSAETGSRTPKDTRSSSRARACRIHERCPDPSTARGLRVPFSGIGYSGAAIVSSPVVQRDR